MKAATYFIAAIFLNTIAEGEQMPVAKLDDRRSLFVGKESCKGKLLQCYYPTYYDFDMCTCLINPTLDCEAPIEVCDDAK